MSWIPDVSTKHAGSIFRVDKGIADILDRFVNKPANKFTQRYAYSFYRNSDSLTAQQIALLKLQKKVIINNVDIVSNSRANLENRFMLAEKS